MGDEPKIDGRLVLSYAKGKGVQIGGVEGDFPPTELVMALEVAKQAIIAKFVMSRLQQEALEAQKKIQTAPAGTPFGR